MKIIYGEKDKGVSPVIATILMVAITVVLAATVYLMVSGYMTGPSHPPLAASLTPMETNTGYYNMTLELTTPAAITNASLINFAWNGTAMHYYASVKSWTSGSINITYKNVVGSNNIVSGDIFQITSPSWDLTGSTIIMSVPSAASGTLSVTLP
ncbi:MAG: archaellin/type IV pilin N-terminal domain-containing protein [Thermoplasmata archaeon]